MPELFVNGQSRSLPGSMNLEQALQRWRATGPVAVAINGTFIPRSQYPQIRLRDGDAIELLSPVAGG